MQALILAGGLGTRLQSIINDRPKPMADIGSKPFLEYQLAFLKQFHITDFILCVGHLHQHIQAYFGDGARWGVKIDYSIEEALLGTGGAIKQAERFIQGPLLALNGDSFFDIDLTRLVQFHQAQQATAPETYLGTMALTQVADASNYGSVRLDQNQRLVSFAEKSAPESSPSAEGELSANGHAPSHSSNLINAGIYVLEPKVLTLIPPARKISLEREVFPTLLKQGYALGGYPAQGFFVDIGTPAGYRHFQTYLQAQERNYDL